MSDHITPVRSLAAMIYPVTYQRDPVSEIFDPLARRALNRCYANQGRWAPVVLPRLTARLFVAWYVRGVDLRAPDPWDESLRRYPRSFIRSAYYNHGWYGSADGVRPQKRTGRYEGLVLVFDAVPVPGTWRVRLMAAEKGDRRLPRKRPGMNEDSKSGRRAGVRVGGVGAGEAL